MEQLDATPPPSDVQRLASAMLQFVVRTDIFHREYVEDCANMPSVYRDYYDLEYKETMQASLKTVNECMEAFNGLVVSFHNEDNILERHWITEWSGYGADDGLQAWKSEAVGGSISLELDTILTTSRLGSAKESPILQSTLAHPMMGGARVLKRLVSEKRRNPLSGDSQWREAV